MADYLLLPASTAGTYREPSPSLGRGKARALNTIIEEDNEDMSPWHATHNRRRNPGGTGRGSTGLGGTGRGGTGQAPAELKIEQWLSPLSDHFPTPRGFHFLAAPILPSSPSAASFEDSNSPQSSTSQPSTNPWNRASVMTDATEFDDLYDDVSEESEDERGGKRDVQVSKLAIPGDSRRSSGSSFEGNRRALPALVIPAPPRDTSNEAWSGHPDFKAITSPVAPTPTSKVPMSPAMMNFMQAQQSLEVPTISAPPSLDGSLSSDQMAQMSAPPTPVIGGRDEDDQAWGGVQLQPGALATLQALSTLSSPASDVDFGEQVLEVPSLDGPQEAPEGPLEAPPGEMTQVRRRPTLVLADIHNRTAAEESAPPVPSQRPREMSTVANGPLRLITAVSRSSILLSPTQARSLAGLTKLDIPSPGGFFSGLSPRARHTWHIPGQTPVEPVEENGPPTSGTAEQFYKLPWNVEPPPPLPRPNLAAAPPSAPPQRPLHMAHGNYSTLPVEQVILLKDKGKDKNNSGPLTAPLTARIVQSSPEIVTARRIPPTPALTSSATIAESQPSPVPSPIEDVVATEIVTEYNPVYARKQQEVALSHLDRTEIWLYAQRAYLKGVEDPADEAHGEEDQREAEVLDVKEREVPPTPPPKDADKDKDKKGDGALTLVRKKTVRFSDTVKSPGVPRSLPSKLLHQESAYYRAFTDFMVRSHGSDVFVNRLPRFEALQAQRLSLRAAHRNQLLGKYQLSVVPQSAKKRMSANVVRGDDVLVDDPAKLRADKEADALLQMTLATWHVAAWKMLSGGRLISSPVHQRLARLSRMAPGGGGGRDRARILDLGGQTACDWAWHAALAYPHAKIYTVTTKAIRQLSNSNIRGPPNHRQVAVERLTKLPFANDQFDLVRAADLHAVLKFVGEHGEDEWESCLHEVLRVLKPGGFVEFTVLDSDIMNAGRLGNAKSVEFGFALKTLGYDPCPTRLFLGRLQRAGFEAARRAWLCLPMGPRPAAVAATAAGTARDAEGRAVPTRQLEAMVSGSADHVAAVTGLAGGWSWERWLLRAETEMAAGALRLADIASHGAALRAAGDRGLEGVHAVVEEGRACGAGWRVLRGYARKPRAGGGDRMGLIDMVLDTGAVR